MAESFKWIANKGGDPLTGFGFNGWPKAFIDLDVTDYEIKNAYNLNLLIPFFWNFFGFTASARAQIPLTENEEEKESVDLHISGTFNSTDEPKDRKNGNGFSYFSSQTDNFNLEDLESGQLNPTPPPTYTRLPNEVGQCKSKVIVKGGGINTIYRCFSSGIFIGYSFKDIAYVYAKSSLTGGGDIDAFNQKLIGYYGLIEDVDDLIFSYDNDVSSTMQDLATINTSNQLIGNGNTSITVTELQVDADFTNSKYDNTPEGDESAIIGIEDELSVEASLNSGNFSYFTYT